MTTTRTRTHTFTTSSLIKPLVKSILEHPLDRDWTLQGFRMLRTYLAPELRLHVWDSRYKVTDVSELHTHPWNFHSLVVAGEVLNTRFTKSSAPEGARDTHREQEILCGEGGHETERESRTVRLFAAEVDVVREGNDYSQFASEIHRSEPKDGTVTLIQREFLKDDDHAFVYVPTGEQWVSAEPRPATAYEVNRICSAALAKWF